MDRRERFQEANRLWFEEGRTARALELYEELLAEDANDPVVLFQLSRVRSALGDRARAHELARRADQNRQGLEARAAERLDHWLEDLSFEPAPRLYPELAPADLDMDVLEGRDPDTVPWAEIAGAANERGMSGLAAIAADRSFGEFADGEDLRELDNLENRAGRERRLLELMYGSRSEQSEPDASSASDSNASAEPSALAAPSMAGALQLAARVTPIVSPIGAPAQLIVRLSNASRAPVLVNARLLLVPAGAPPTAGEIVTTLLGPVGYANSVAFTVRSGEPAAHDFIELAPGGVIERSFPLSSRESLHVPGDYEISVAYRNVVPQRVGTLVAATGAIAATASFTRTA